MDKWEEGQRARWIGGKMGGVLNGQIGGRRVDGQMGGNMYGQRDNMDGWVDGKTGR